METFLTVDSPVGEEGPLNCAVMFVDLMNSSEFASVLGLREYAHHVESFRGLCIEACTYYFDMFLEGRYRRGLEVEFSAVGDELAVFVHSGKLYNDVYQLICLAIVLKCGWLSAPLNRQRISSGLGSAELAVGIHCGPVWARRAHDGFEKTGFAINLAKRVESASRDGERFRISVSDPAFKQVNRRMRNLLFGPRRVLPMKGVVVPIGVYEVFESFLNPRPRLLPAHHEMFPVVARQALQSNTFDLWIHSCLQVWEEAATDEVSDANLALCEQTLSIDPRNAASLYYAAQGFRQRGQLAKARLYLQDLVRVWTGFGDGWLEYGRLLKEMGEHKPAREAVLQARRFGVDEKEEDLPDSGE